MVSTLKFVAKTKQEVLSGVFTVSNLKINDANPDEWSDNNILTYDNIQLIINGQAYNGKYSTWAGAMLSEGDLFEQCINAYLRQDINYKFDNSWNIFSKLTRYSKKYNGFRLLLPQLKYDSLRMYKLDLVTPDGKYYAWNSEKFMLLDRGNTICTNYENFYMDSLYGDVKDILSGGTKCLYMSKETRTWIKDMGGKQYF